MKLIDRYILKCHIGPYFFGLAIITFIFVMDFIFRYLDLFIGKGVSFPVVLEFFVLSLGYMFALIIPMAVMPATLMAFGQLASENEITALKASGVSLYRMILPVLIASACLSALLIVYNNIILPESNHRLMNLMIDIGRMRPTIEIKENIFSDAVKGYSILIKEKKHPRVLMQIFAKKNGIFCGGMEATYVIKNSVSKSNGLSQQGKGADRTRTKNPVSGEERDRKGTARIFLARADEGNKKRIG